MNAKKYIAMLSILSIMQSVNGGGKTVELKLTEEQEQDLIGQLQTSIPAQQTSLASGKVLPKSEMYESVNKVINKINLMLKTQYLPKALFDRHTQDMIDEYQQIKATFPREFTTTMPNILTQVSDYNSLFYETNPALKLSVDKVGSFFCVEGLRYCNSLV